MVSINSFNAVECDKFDPNDIAAYFEQELNPKDPTKLEYKSSWGEGKIDLTPAIKAGETVTELELVTDDGAPYIKYTREDGEFNCIKVDTLNGLMKFLKLQDVNQVIKPKTGDVYIYEETTGTFKPFDLQTFVNTTKLDIRDLQKNLTTLTQAWNALDDRIRALEKKLTPPEGAPSDVSVAFGNRNVYGDVTNTDKRTHGVFTHNPNDKLIDDLYFS